jgi:heat-inducible transcriptional repressor
MISSNTILEEMTDRSREVFRRVVESFLSSGDPVGSRTLTRSFSEKLSAATIRNVMQDLEYMGLLGSPHASAGRVPTQLGLRMFVDTLLEVGTVSADDRERIESTSANEGAGVGTLLDEITATLSGVTGSASVVLAPKFEAQIRHIEFVNLSPDRALVVLVHTDGHVENRMFTPPPGQTPSSLREAANFLNSFAEGRTLSELLLVIKDEIIRRRQEIDVLARAMVESGLALSDLRRPFRASDRPWPVESDRRCDRIDRHPTDSPALRRSRTEARHR